MPSHSSIATTLAVAAAACAEPPTAPPQPAKLVPVQQAPTAMIPGGTVDTIAVRVLSASGEPVRGYRVEWSGDGEITPLDSVTDGLGRAHARWELPRWPVPWMSWSIGPSGSYVAQAVVPGFSAVTFATAARSFQADQVDAAFHYACGIRQRGLWCWGDARPLGFSERNATPKQVTLPQGVEAVVVRAAQTTACILDAAGLPRCTSRDQTQPFTPVVGAPPLQDLAKGEDLVRSQVQFCGRALVDATPWCWSFSGQSFSAAQQASLIPLEAVQTGGQFACGLRTGGTVWCWGNNDHGQLGDGTNVSRSAPDLVLGLPPVVSLGANWRGVCAAEESDGTIWCWGLGPHGYATNLPTRITVPEIRGTQVVVSGTGDGYVIADGVLKAWYGRQMLDLFTLAHHVVVVEVSGDGQSCIRSSTSEVYCSWVLVHGGSETSPYPSDLVPINSP